MKIKFKNIIIFIFIALVLVLVFMLLSRQKEEDSGLVGTTTSGSSVVPSSSDAGAVGIGEDFLVLLLNIKNIELDDAIFSDSAFKNLKDSSILLIPDGGEGRPNPFAPLGEDDVSMPDDLFLSPTEEETKEILSSVEFGEGLLFEDQEKESTE